MPSAAFTTLGCKVNQYETQKILESFEGAGFEIVPFEGRADVYVINTCSVTNDAERKSRSTIRRANRHNPDGKVVVTGCAAQMGINRGEPFEGADLIVENPSKLQTFQRFAAKWPDLLPPATTSHGAVANSPHHGRTRATLKVQDGCNVMCSYCSIPFTRPGMVSRPYQEVLKEAQKLSEMGFQEAILTGVLIGSYDAASGSGGPSFDELVQLLSAESGLSRLRISSIEMHQVTPAIIELARSGHVVPHFHIPLQAGDSRVLKDMNRRYDQDDFIRLCHRLYRELPDVSLTTDIMVGFPTEDEDRFQSSLFVCEQVKFLSAHVFTFSPRWGTPAEGLGDPVAAEEKASRRLRLMEVTKRTGEAHMKRFLGRTMRVLIEGKPTREGLLQGLTDNYLPVRLAGPATMCRTLQWVRLDEFREGAVFGEWVPEPTPTRTVLPMTANA
jgi:threonylcarbamoyladenosine tRNA methylthiotransferase MtaB